MMSQLDMTVRIAGENGEGVLSVGDVLALSLTRLGLHVYTFQNLPAEIKGGASMTQVRVSDQPVRSPGDRIDVLMAWNQENYDLHISEVREEGLVLYDPSEAQPDSSQPVHHYAVPLNQMVRDEIKQVRSKNVLAYAILCAYLGVPKEQADSDIRRRWGRRPELLEGNLRALELGYRFVEEQFSERHLTLPKIQLETPRLLLKGNEALCLGAVAAGLQVFAGYPITPASDIMEWLSQNLPRFGGVVIQTEDEIAALATCIGASFAGKKVMTATSGPGLSLMAEQIGLATMEELPVVIIDAQRGGPSTGMPTKPEQGDLDLAIYGRHGDAPRIVIAPYDVEDCFFTAILAFNLAEKYQSPVVLLSDQHLAHRSQSINQPDLSKIEILERFTPPLSEQAPLNGSEDHFMRYEDTETGISPMPIPGVHPQHYVATGLEHNEYAHIDYSPRMHVKMTHKRFRKMEQVAREPGMVYRYGDPQAKFGVIAWGSTVGPTIEAIDRLTKEGFEVEALFPKLLYPVPKEPIEEFLNSKEQVSVIELNYLGQYANLLQSVFCRPLLRFNKYQGLPFRAIEIYDYIKRVLTHPPAEIADRMAAVVKE